MRTNVLVDAIVRQTTVLIAQLTVHKGGRSPLAHLADDVFLSLSKELEEQGVTRTVVADMFGLALRSYQRRVNRLRQDDSGGRTLWQTVFEFIKERGPVARAELANRFRHDDAEAVTAVIADLTRTGLISRTGIGRRAVYTIASDEVLQHLARQDNEEVASAMVWLDLCRHPGALTAEVATRLGLDEESVVEAVDELRSQGQITSEPGAPLEASAMSIPLGAEQPYLYPPFDQ